MEQHYLMLKMHRSSNMTENEKNELKKAKDNIKTTKNKTRKLVTIPGTITLISIITFILSSIIGMNTNPIFSIYVNVIAISIGTISILAILICTIIRNKIIIKVEDEYFKLKKELDEKYISEDKTNNNSNSKNNNTKIKNKKSITKKIINTIISLIIIGSIITGIVLTTQHYNSYELQYSSVDSTGLDYVDIDIKLINNSNDNLKFSPSDFTIMVKGNPVKAKYIVYDKEYYDTTITLNKNVTFTIKFTLTGFEIDNPLKIHHLGKELKFDKTVKFNKNNLGNETNYVHTT